MSYQRTIWIPILLLAFVGWFFDKLNLHGDTDPPQGRSGLAMYVDNKTGCEYLGRAWGGLTPRLDANGKPSCGVR